MTAQTRWRPPGALPLPQFCGPLAATPRKVRLGRSWYLLALAVLLAGVVWLGFGAGSVERQVDAFQRVPLPQGGLVSLNHSGDYVVYYEAPGAAYRQVPSFEVSVVPVSGGASINSLQAYIQDVSYGFGSRQGRAELTLQVSRPGTFRVEAPGEPTVAGGGDLAFGPSIAGGLVGGVLVGFLIMVVGAVGGVVLFIIRCVRASRRRAQIRMALLQYRAGPPMRAPLYPQAGPVTGGYGFKVIQRTEGVTIRQPACP